MKLTVKQKISFLNHLFKVMTRSHHKELQPLLSHYIKNDSVVFDVGGHAGQFTKLFARMASKGKVFVFEPSVYSRSILQIMVGLKFLQHVFVLPFGLSDRVSQATIHTPVKKRGSLGYGLAFVGSTENSQRELVSSDIILSTLDQVVAGLGVDRVDFIKADIEGSELLLLQGAETTLKNHHPALLLEISDAALARNKHSGKALVEYLQQLGYQKMLKVNIETAMLEREVGFDENEFNGDYIFTV